MAYVIGNDCIACGTCIDECPAGAISEGDIYSINPEPCSMPFLYALFLSPYSGRLIASLGQTSAHVPHSVQASGLIE